MPGPGVLAVEESNLGKLCQKMKSQGHRTASKRKHKYLNFVISKIPDVLAVVFYQ